MSVWYKANQYGVQKIQASLLPDGSLRLAGGVIVPVQSQWGRHFQDERMAAIVALDEMDGAVDRLLKEVAAAQKRQQAHRKKYAQVLAEGEKPDGPRPEAAKGEAV